MENYLNIKFLGGKKNPSFDILAVFQTTKRLYNFKNTSIPYFLILYWGEKKKKSNMLEFSTPELSVSMLQAPPIDYEKTAVPVFSVFVKLP